MATAVNTRVQGDGRPYSETEPGVQIYSATASATGAGSGEFTFQYDFNADQAQGATLYVAVTRIAISTAAIAATSGWSAVGSTGHWERSVSLGLLLAGGAMTATHDSTTALGSWYGFVNLGRVLAGQAGRVEVYTEDSNASQTAQCTVEGLISDHPIAGRWWLSA